jgi:hypothetical protein
MIARLVFIGIAWLICGSVFARAFADEFPHSADRRCDESLGEIPPAEPDPPQAELAPEEAASSSQIPPPPVVIPEPPSEPSRFILWPMEYVLRPQTLPEGMIELGGSARVFRPQSGPLRTSGDDSVPGAFYTLSMLSWF